ncbi:hypothetical protein J6590_032294 [Homalodisca vitripennis]|nr:hypothetical protein J6590_032294 [Homalodisca vitripennis]
MPARLTSILSFGVINKAQTQETMFRFPAVRLRHGRDSAHARKVVMSRNMLADARVGGAYVAVKVVPDCYVCAWEWSLELVKVPNQPRSQITKVHLLQCYNKQGHNIVKNPKYYHFLLLNVYSLHLPLRITPNLAAIHLLLTPVNFHSNGPTLISWAECIMRYPPSVVQVIVTRCSAHYTYKTLRHIRTHTDLRVGLVKCKTDLKKFGVLQRPTHLLMCSLKVASLLET